MSTHIMDMSRISRKFSAVYHLQRLGFIYSHPNKKPTTYTGKLEFCIRYSSQEEEAIDVINGTEYRTPYPHILIKQPDFVHTYSFKKPRDAVYFQYPPAYEKQMRDAGLLHPPFCWQMQLTPEINSLLKKMKDMMPFTHQEYIADWLDIHALQVIEMILAQRDSTCHEPDHLEKGINRITSYFDLNFASDFDLDQLLRENGFSRRSFFRHWKKFHDKSPNEYLQELKLQHACSQLVETTLPIWQITEELNFKNTYYLCRVFKKRFGITPQQYRKTHAPEIFN